MPSQCLDPSLTTMSVAAGSCSSSPDRLSSLQLARLTTLAAIGCRVGGLDRLHDVEPVLVKKERVFAEQALELRNQGMFVGNNPRFELIQGSMDLCELSFIAHSFFRFAQRRRHAILRGAGLPPRGGQMTLGRAACLKLFSVHGQVTTMEPQRARCA